MSMYGPLAGYEGGVPMFSASIWCTQSHTRSLFIANSNSLIVLHSEPYNVCFHPHTLSKP